MRAALVFWAALDMAGCDPPAPGDECSAADEMVCGKASGGSTVALLCTSRVTGPAQWAYSTNCNTCDHVTNCKTELVCDGTNVANEDLHCDVPGAAACALGVSAHVLKCSAANTWALFNDCSAHGMHCGRLADGNLGCVAN